MERKRRFQTRQQYAEHKAKETKFDKANKSLNYLIAIVAILIVVTLVIIITRDPSPNNEVLQEEQPVDVATNESSEEDEEQTTETEDEETTENMDAEQNEETSTDQSDEQSAEVDNTISPSSDPAVKEVITNSNWQPYPTAQTGEHVSTFQKGHIDYEEKLKAIFSVLELEQENSIVLSVRNNGSANSAIAVVTSMDKEQKYRVSIEWIDNEGWKPIQVEVLSTV